MENILNQMINEAAAPAPAPAINTLRTVDPAHSFRQGDVITQGGLRHIQERVAANDGFRGIGTLVGEFNNNVEEIRRAAGLDWNPVKVQGCAVSKRGGVVEVPNQFFLFQGGPSVKEPKPLPVPSVTSAYTVHTNSQLIGMMSDFATEADLRITRVGSLDGGSRIFAVATSDVKEEVAVGDIISLQFILQSGHGNGVATKVAGRANRLTCSNGAMISMAAGRVSLSHRTGLTVMRIAGVRDIVLKAAEAFTGYVAQLRGLYQTPATPAIIRLALAQYLLTDDADWATVVRNLAGREMADQAGAGDSRRVGAEVIERVLAAEASRPVINRMFQGLTNTRLLSAVVEATDHQYGPALNRNTLGHAHNGMTYYSTHVRGRSAESALKTNLDRDDAKGFANLLTAQYVPAMQQVMGARAQVALPLPRH